MSITPLSGGLTADQLLALQQQVADSFATNDSEVDGHQQLLDTDILAQGGDAAVNEIRTKMYGSVKDPAEALRLAQETAAAFTLANNTITLPPPEGDAGSSDPGGLTGRIDDAANGAPIDMFAIMALMLKLEANLRKTASESATAEAQISADLKNAAGDEIEKAAQDHFVGACVSGATQICGGALGMAAGVNSLATVGTAAAAAEAVQAPTVVESSENAAGEMKTTTPQDTWSAGEPGDIEMQEFSSSTPQSAQAQAQANVDGAAADSVNPQGQPHATADTQTTTEASDARVSAQAKEAAAKDEYFQSQRAKSDAFNNAFKGADAWSQAAGGVGGTLTGTGGVTSGVQDQAAAEHERAQKKDEAQADLETGFAQSSKSTLDALRDTSRQLVSAFDANTQSVDQSNRRAVA